LSIAPSQKKNALAMEAVILFIPKGKKIKVNSAPAETKNGNQTQKVLRRERPKK
jgi:hypothetical protein